jgi:hypothetical protein
MKLYMFRTVRLSIIRSLFTVHSAMVHVIQVSRQLSSRTRTKLQFHPGPAPKLSTKNPYVNSRPYQTTSEMLQLFDPFNVYFWGTSAELLPKAALSQVMSLLFVGRYGKARFSPDVFSSNFIFGVSLNTSTYADIGSSLTKLVFTLHEGPHTYDNNPPPLTFVIWKCMK